MHEAVTYLGLCKQKMCNKSNRRCSVVLPNLGALLYKIHIITMIVKTLPFTNRIFQTWLLPIADKSKTNVIVTTYLNRTFWYTWACITAKLQKAIQNSHFKMSRTEETLFCSSSLGHLPLVLVGACYQRSSYGNTIILV